MREISSFVKDRARKSDGRWWGGVFGLSRGGEFSFKRKRGCDHVHDEKSGWRGDRPSRKSQQEGSIIKNSYQTKRRKSLILREKERSSTKWLGRWPLLIHFSKRKAPMREATFGRRLTLS